VRHGQWTVHGERTVYASDRLAVVLADVEEPGGVRVPEHHLVRCRIPASACVVLDAGTRDADERVLLIHRHRFIPDTWGWEIPGGGIEPGETPADAAAREVEEETGWRPDGALAPLVRLHPSSGLLDQTFHCFVTRGATRVGAPTSGGEAAEVAWVPRAEVVARIDAGEITDGLTLTGLYAWLYRSAAGSLPLPPDGSGGSDGSDGLDRPATSRHATLPG
jgi:8-oxo-dGTP pyrophosphatase MutT (NUDIX family)